MNGSTQVDIVSIASPIAIGLETNTTGFKSDLIKLVMKLNSTIGPNIIANTTDVLVFLISP
jgi:hypothetical protein